METGKAGSISLFRPPIAEGAASALWRYLRSLVLVRGGGALGPAPFIGIGQEARENIA